MEYIVYVLESKNSSPRYIGYSKDVQKRLREHNQGKCSATKHKGPWTVIYLEKQPGLEQAQKREKFFKSGNGRAALKNLIRNKPYHAGVAELAYAQD